MEKLIKEFTEDLSLHTGCYKTTKEDFSKNIDKYLSLKSFDDITNIEGRKLNPLIWIIAYQMDDLFDILIEKNLNEKIKFENYKDWIISFSIENKKTEFLLHLLSHNLITKKDILNKADALCLFSSDLFEKFFINNKSNWENNNFSLLSKCVEGYFIAGIDKCLNHNYSNYNFIDKDIVYYIIESSFLNQEDLRIEQVYNKFNTFRNLKEVIDENKEEFFNLSFYRIFKFKNNFNVFLKLTDKSIFENKKIIKKIFESTIEDNLVEFVKKYPEESKSHIINSNRKDIGKVKNILFFIDMNNEISNNNNNKNKLKI